MATRMQQRRGTAAQWTAANPILAAGEIGYETDTGKFKIGDGTNTWSLLKYFLNLEALDIDADGFITDDQKGVNNGVATLDSNGLVPVIQMPDQYITDKIITKIGEVVGAAPSTLNTLNEIAAAFDNDPNYADTISAALDLKAPKASPAITGTATFVNATFSGDVDVQTMPLNDSSTKPATTAFVAGRIQNVNTVISTLASEIDASLETLGANDASQASSLEALDVRLDSAEASITGNTASIATINTTLSDHTSDISALDVRVDATESDISTINADITSIESNIDTVETNITGIQSDVTTLQNDLNAAETDISALQSGATTTTSTISTIQNNLTSMSTEIDGIDTRLTAAETDIDALQTSATSASGHASATTNVHGIANTADLATKSYADNAKTEAISTSATAIALKADIASPTFTGTVVLPATTSIGTVSATEIGYVDGVTSAIQTQLDAKAPLESPALTGTPTAPTATAGTDTTQIATTAFVQDAIEAVVGAAPAALNTLSELADALADDANYASTVTSALALKAPLASPTFTGTVTLPSSTSIGNVSSTEIGYIDGVTSSIQTQLDAKAPSANPTLTGTVALPAASSVTLNGTALSTTLALKADNAATINTMSGSHTIVSADVSNVREMSNGGTITIPSDTSWWPVGATIDVLQTGSSQVTIGAGSGVTLNATPGLKLRAQWSSATILKRAANTFVALGDLSA